MKKDNRKEGDDSVALLLEPILRGAALQNFVDVAALPASLTQPFRPIVSDDVASASHAEACRLAFELISHLTSKSIEQMKFLPSLAAL
jgi:hypothetical protein